MIPNEALFIVHVSIVALFTIASLSLGLAALTTMICLCGIMSNFFVTKQIALFGFDVVSTDVFAVGCILGLNLMQEYFGREAVKKTIFINFMFLIFSLIASYLHLGYIPNSFDFAHDHFAVILSPMTRIIIASVSVYLLVQIIDARVYRWLHTVFAGRHLIARNLIALSISQLIDTVLFSIAALYGTVHSIIHVMIVSYCIKMFVVICNAPFISISRLFMKDNLTKKNHD